MCVCVCVCVCLKEICMSVCVRMHIHVQKQGIHVVQAFGGQREMLEELFMCVGVCASMCAYIHMEYVCVCVYAYIDT